MFDSSCGTVPASFILYETEENHEI
jgi:hypothetical protein